MTTYFVSNAGSNTAPYDTEAKAANALATIAALPWTNADVVKLSSTHTETANAAITYTFPTTIGLQLLSVTFNGSGTGGLAVGAAINVGAANAAFTLSTGFVYAYGISFVAATNNNGACDMIIGQGILSIGQKYEKCTFSAPSVSVNAQIIVGANAASTIDDVQINLVDCTFSNGAIKSILLAGGIIDMENLALAGTAPATVFANAAGGAAIDCTISASDLSGVAWTNLVSVATGVPGHEVTFRQCKLAAGFSSITTGTIPGPGQYHVELFDCDAGDNHYTYTKVDYEGTCSMSNTVYTADATNGTDSFSILMASSANASFVWPLHAPELSYFNAALGSPITATVETVNDGTTFTDKELWQETLAKITSGSTKATWDTSDRVDDILTNGANQDTSTKSWTGTGGFGSAVKQKLETITVVPQEVGPFLVQVHLAKASSSVYVSPALLASTSKVWMNPNGMFINEQPSSGGGTTVIAGVIGG